MTTIRRFLVAGGTGRQGGGVVNALLADTSTSISPEDIYVLTRNPSSPASMRLAKRGVHLIHGDLNAPAAILQQFVDASDLGVFMAQAHGPTEVEDAKGFIEASAVAGVPYFVYSSVDRGGKELSDKDPSYCKTFSDKFLCETHLIAVSTHSKEDSRPGQSMDYTILRPTWIADNANWGFAGRLCMTAWRDNMKGKRLQIVTTADVGRWAVEALLRPDKAGIRNTARSIASDELTFEEVDEIIREETGAPVATFNWVLTKLMVWAIKDLRTMFNFINERDYGADMEELKQTLRPTTFRMYAKGLRV